MRRESRFQTAVLLTATALTVASIALMPRTPSLGDETTGDAELAATVRDLAGNAPEHSLSVALIENGEIRFAGVGDTGGDDPLPVYETTPYEIGSIGKAMTGMLLADSGLDPETPVSRLLRDVRFSDPEVASATLAELSSHQAGLASVRMTPLSGTKTVAHRVTGIDPYVGDDRASVLSDAAAASASDRREITWHNGGTGVFILVAVLPFVAWDVIPPVVWLLGVAALAAATVLTARRWPELPWRVTGQGWTPTSATIPGALLITLLAALALT